MKSFFFFLTLILFGFFPRSKPPNTHTQKKTHKKIKCLALRGQSAGLQTEEEIQNVVMAAIGKGGAAGAAAPAAAAKSGKGGEYDEIIDEALEEDFGDDQY